MQTSVFIETVPRVRQLLRLEIDRVLRQFRPGGHRSNLRGIGSEFRGFKAYEPSDPPSAVDWVAAERISDDPTLEPVSRSYHPERMVSVLFILDIRDSMEQPPQKFSHAAALLWLFAFSAFKTKDYFRVFLHGPISLPNSEWLHCEEDVVEFFRHAVTRAGSHTGISAPQTFSDLEELRLRDSLVVIVSDFTTDWIRELESIRRLDVSTRNIKLLFFMLDEWRGYVFTGYGMELRDPRTGLSRRYTEREIKKLILANEKRTAMFKESVHPFNSHLVSVSLLVDPLESAGKALLRFGF